MRKVMSRFNKIIPNILQNKTLGRRLLSSNGGSSDISNISLSQPLPEQDKKYRFSNVDSEKYERTTVTTLPNGLRVASKEHFGSFCTVGVVVNSGSRFEVAYPSGINHFLEKLAFNSTLKFPDRDKILHKLDQFGGICDCQSSRDTFLYGVSAMSSGLDTVMEILGDVVLRPIIETEHMDMAGQMIQFELETLMMRPEQETILMDMIHAAAYDGNTLGLAKLCPPENIEKINRSLLYTYLKHHYTPDRMVIAGVGIKHEDLLEATQKYFVNEKPIWDNSIEGVKVTDIKPDPSVAMYTGGMITEECEIPTHFGPSELPELAHIVIGLEGHSHVHKDFIPMCVLNMIMGGGSSFSAGGPGKGMYTRLYLNVLNRYHWLYSATAYNHAYIDTGLFCIHASAPPKYVHAVSDVIIREIINMSGQITENELNRAKIQLQSMLLMNLETRSVIFEDIGRQVLASGIRKTPQEFIKEINAVTEEDVHRVAQKLIKSSPSIAARGQIKKIQSYDKLCQSLAENKPRRSIGNFFS